MKARATTARVGEPVGGTAGKRTSSGTKAGGKEPARRSRMDPELRIEMILDAATNYFAEHGFEAQIKDLANQIGVSESLIFRYFRTKQSLVEEVYERIFLKRWSRDWEAGLRERSRPLRDRLEAFYLSYLDAVDDPRWIRVSVYAGLAGHDIVKRYVETHVNHLLVTITRELEAEWKIRPPKDDAGLELAWHLHSTFIYFLIRKHIHRMPVAQDRAALVAGVVDNFLCGCGSSSRPVKPPARAVASARPHPPETAERERLASS